MWFMVPILCWFFFRLRFIAHNNFVPCLLFPFFVFCFICFITFDTKSFYSFSISFVWILFFLFIPTTIFIPFTIQSQLFKWLETPCQHNNNNNNDDENYRALKHSCHSPSPLVCWQSKERKKRKEKNVTQTIWFSFSFETFSSIFINLYRESVCK